ncbi:protein CSN12 [Parathielavia hyrcaniae]|uniref:Protein CSN12 homolog n=1 Tax=Parathielavia hyrcaniae TaxID=113614 RepID=A0AAN6Q482_9PEZI|nr:protein CSN12 [Parathielavia hyrcaniae]
MEFNTAFFHEFSEAHAQQDGYRLARTLTPDLPTDKLRKIWRSQNAHSIRSFLKRGLQGNAAFTGGLDHEELPGWVEVYATYWNALGEILAARESSNEGKNKSSELVWTRAYEGWIDLLNALLRGYQSHKFKNWTIICLYTVCKHLRLFAMKADDERNSNNVVDDSPAANFQDDFDPETNKRQKLEDCVRQLFKAFNICQQDRAALEESRKWGSYYIANLLLKSYFKLNSASLSKNILKNLHAGGKDMPDVSAFPKSQQVTFKYHEGVLAFLEENYARAEACLTDAWNKCHKDAVRNKERILAYLIPCHLITSHTLPTEALLESYPRLQKLFLPLCRCIKRGELHKFDLALQEGEDEFVRRRIYLTLERGRDVALRNLLRKVFIARGFEEAKDGEKPVRRTRVPVAEFAAAISLGSQERIDNDEVECLLANMIYKGFMKGYISRQHSTVVLSKSGAFPGTGV